MVLFFISVVLVLAFGWFLYGFPYVLAFTAGLLEWCQSLLLQCLEYLIIAKVFLVWLGIIIVTGSFIYALLKASLTSFRAYRQVKRLPLADYKDIVIIKDNNLIAAFTHGFFRPKIYMSAGLINSLINSELKAVYLHELHHKNRKDPLRFFILSILRDAFFYIPISRFIERFLYDRMEVAADDAAVAGMKEPFSLAAAILNISGFNNEMHMLQPASIGGSGSTEWRIRRLIEGAEERVKLPPIKTLAGSIFISAVLTFSLVFPLFASFPEPGHCDTDHCAVHMEKLGKGCQTHCEVSEHKH